jgi:uncharacterized membrane protein YcaP (DUF421 family)
MARECISEDELMVKLREHGIESLEGVKDVYVESDGQLSVIPRGGTGSRVAEGQSVKRYLLRKHS